MTPLAVFTALLPRLESVGGQIKDAQIHADGYFIIGSDHPDVALIHGRGDDTVQIRCRKGMFPPTRAHVDVDDIMTIIEGWMKEAGGKCGQNRAATLRQKRQEWGVDRPTPRRAARSRGKSMRDFIRENRERLDSIIRRTNPDVTLDDRERSIWILNDEGLYNWARSEGVKI